MKKSTLLSFFFACLAYTASACYTDFTISGCFVSGSPVTLTGQRFAASDWNANIVQGWEYTDNNGVSWHPIAGATSGTYQITSMTLAQVTWKYRYWAKELSPHMGAVQFQIYASVGKPIPQCGVTPVRLAFFSGTKTINGTAVLSWKNFIETNVRQFELQRSFDGTLFSSVDTLLPLGENTTYTVEDGYGTAPIAYYRLKAVDNNNLSSFSAVIKISSGTYTSIDVGPSPTTGVIRAYVHGSTQGDLKIIVTDIVGRTMKNVSFGDGVIDLSTLPPGMYVYRIVDMTGVAIYTKKVQKI